MNPFGVEIGTKIRCYDTFFSRKAPDDVDFNNFKEGVVIKIEKWLSTGYCYHYYYKVQKICIGGYVTPSERTSDFFISKLRTEKRYLKILTNQLSLILH
jgi:hypothetical protein